MDFVVEAGYADEAQDLTVTLSGVASLDGFRRLVTVLADDPRAHAGMLLLVDLTDLNMTTLDGEDVEALAVLLSERDWEQPARAVAYVARDPSTLQAASHVRAHLGGTISNRRVFTARADAVSWLRQGSPGSAPEPRS
jgi:hypothetical protein